MEHKDVVIEFDWTYPENEYSIRPTLPIPGNGRVNGVWTGNEDILKILLNEHGKYRITYQDDNTKLICDGLVLGYIAAIRVLESYWRK